MGYTAMIVEILVVSTCRSIGTHAPIGNFSLVSIKKMSHWHTTIVYMKEAKIERVQRM
jgi:hypothetical protein